jgi:purine-nucleoside phosphorylase
VGGTAEAFYVATAAAQEIGSRTGHDRHDVAVVLGSGWANAVDEIGDDRIDVPMAELPGFAPIGVSGHSPLVASVAVGDRRVLALGGRVHLYEGHAPAVVVHGVRSAVLAGCSVVVLTNACGGLRPDLGPGHRVLISDHINLTGQSPLTGPEPPRGFGVRFLDITQVYDPELRALARRVDPTLTEGIYISVHGPTYETAAEVRMLRGFGGDIVGMSTVHEAIAARQLSARVLGIGLVTNAGAGLSTDPVEHERILKVGQGASAALGRTLRGIVERLE